MTSTFPAPPAPGPFGRLGPLRVLVAAFVLAVSAEVHGEELDNIWCPLKPDEKALSKFHTTYEGKSVYFCCRDCVTAFEKDPPAYLGVLPQFTAEGRPAWRQPIDRVWNTGARFPGLAFGLLAFGGISACRAVLGLFGVTSWPRRALAAAGSPTGLAAISLAALGGEAVSAHLDRAEARRIVAEADLEQWIHFATFTDYGTPPVPAPPAHSRRMEVTYYRGNDERSELLFNGGRYRTSSFDLSICRADGVALQPGDPAPRANALFLRVRINRAPGTPDYFWTRGRMDLIFATRESGRFLGRHEPVADAIPLQTLEPMQRWEFRYPLAAFARAKAESRVAGIVYLCEKRFDEEKGLIGGRFHYGFQFDLDLADGSVQPASSVWMGSLYRSRTLRIWQIPDHEWLSTDPIPVIEGEHATDDPGILGITGHQSDLD